MNTLDPTIRDYLAQIGRRGGKRSRRRLSSSQARRMVAVREARRAYRAFHSRCFWSSAPDYQPSLDDVEWVAGQLRKYGGAAGWKVAQRLCP